MRGNIFAMRSGLVTPSSLLARNLRIRSGTATWVSRCKLCQTVSKDWKTATALPVTKVTTSSAHHATCAVPAVIQDVNQARGWPGHDGAQSSSHNMTLRWQVPAGAAGGQQLGGRSSSRVVARHHGVKHHAAGPDVDLAAAVLEAAEHLRIKRARVCLSLQAAACAAHATEGRCCSECSPAGRTLELDHSSPQAPCTCGKADSCPSALIVPQPPYQAKVGSAPPGR